MTKDWDKMTTDEKLESLKSDVQWILDTLAPMDRNITKIAGGLSSVLEELPSLKKPKTP